MLVDTDVLIWYLRGQAKAAQAIDQIDALRLSAVTFMELVQGCRNKSELELLKQDMAKRSAEILPLTPAISQRAMVLVETHALVNGLKMADALIAATALEHGLNLMTANAKHFRCVDGLVISAFQP